MSTTHIKEEVNHLKYSIEIPLLPPPLLSISADEYKSFKDQFPHQQLSTPLLTFDRETDFFLTSLKTLPLDQQLTNIEQYVRQHAFYDMKNAEVNGLKFQKPNQERLFICEQRIQQLTTEHPELATQLQGKKRAGVCADFALITTAMLRQAGILAGVSKGFLPDGKKVTTKHAHACSFAILPYKKKENQIILIDGTPHNTEVQPLASLTEREQQYTKQQQLLTKEMMEKSEKIQQIIEQHNNPEEIKKHLQPLCNGELEDVMNTFLHTTVTPKHYQRISNLLNAYRYSPIATSENLEEIKTFLSSQLSHPSDTIIKEEETGTQLFEILRTFLTRFEKNHKSLSAFDVLDSLIELSKDSLDTNEYFALTLISRYLKAEKMFL